MIKERIARRVFGEGNGTGAMLDQMLEKADQKLENFDNAVSPGEEAHHRRSFNSDIPISEDALLNLTARQYAELVPTMTRLQLVEMRKSSRYYDEQFVSTSDEAPASFFKELEVLAKSKGAVDVKYVKDLPPNAIFKDKGIPHKNAVVFTVEMNKEQIKTAPSFEAFHEVSKGYKNLAIISNAMVDLMRENGYSAYPGTSLGGLTDYPHIAEKAGLGAIGYHGLLIQPEGGARLRINTVYTNLENLPVQEENPHQWIREFCSGCKKCIRRCPAEAIYSEPQPRKGGGKTCIETKKCLDYFSANHGCAVCVKVCPFSNAGYEKIKKGFDKKRLA